MNVIRANFSLTAAFKNINCIKQSVSESSEHKLLRRLLKVLVSFKYLNQQSCLVTIREKKQLIVQATHTYITR